MKPLSRRLKKFFHKNNANTMSSKSSDGRRRNSLTKDDETAIVNNVDTFLQMLVGSLHRIGKATKRVRQNMEGNDQDSTERTSPPPSGEDSNRHTNSSGEELDSSLDGARKVPRLLTPERNKTSSILRRTCSLRRTPSTPQHKLNNSLTTRADLRKENEHFIAHERIYRWLENGDTFKGTYKSDEYLSEDELASDLSLATKENDKSHALKLDEDQSPSVSTIMREEQHLPDVRNQESSRPTRLPVMGKAALLSNRHRPRQPTTAQVVHGLVFDRFQEQLVTLHQRSLGRQMKALTRLEEEEKSSVPDVRYDQHDGASLDTSHLLFGDPHSMSTNYTYDSYENARYENGPYENCNNINLNLNMNVNGQVTLNVSNHHYHQGRPRQPSPTGSLTSIEINAANETRGAGKTKRGREAKQTRRSTTAKQAQQAKEPKHSRKDEEGKTAKRARKTSKTEPEQPKQERAKSEEHEEVRRSTENSTVKSILKFKTASLRKGPVYDPEAPQFAPVAPLMSSSSGEEIGTVAGSEPSIREKLEQLEIQKEVELKVIAQTKTALHFCRNDEALRNSPYVVEAERIKLISKLKLHAIHKEMERLCNPQVEEVSSSVTCGRGGRGSLLLRGLTFPLFGGSSASSLPGDEDGQRWYVCVLTHGTDVRASEATDCTEDGRLRFDRQFRFDDLPLNFEIVLTVYTMQIPFARHQTSSSNPPPPQPPASDCLCDKNTCSSCLHLCDSPACVREATPPSPTKDFKATPRLGESTPTPSPKGKVATPTFSDCGSRTLRLNSLHHPDELRLHRGTSVFNPLDGAFTLISETRVQPAGSLEGPVDLWEGRGGVTTHCWARLAHNRLTFWPRQRRTARPLLVVDLRFVKGKEVAVVATDEYPKSRTLLLKVAKTVPAANYETYHMTMPSHDDLQKWKLELNHVLEMLWHWRCKKS